MKFYFSVLFLLLVIFSSCKKKEEESDARYSSSYKVISVVNGGTIKGTVKSDANQKYPMTIKTQKDQDVCGASHPNLSIPNPNGAVPNCIITLDHITEGKDFPKQEYSLDQRGCDFHPHVQIVKLGLPVVMINSDHALHNYHIFYNGETVVNEAQPEDAPPREVDLKQKGLHTVTCDVHPWMKGYIWMAEHPYCTLCDSSGAFVLTDVPPGKYKLILWRDNWNLEEAKNTAGVIESYTWGKDFSKEQEITVVAGKDVIVDFVLP